MRRSAVTWAPKRVPDIGEVAATRVALLELRDERRLVQEGYELLDEKRVMLATEILRDLRAHEVAQTALDRLVALKFIHPALAADAGFAERFSREAKALARLNHPHIVTVFDAGLSAHGVYIAMERLHGCDLGQRLASGWRPGRCRS